MLERQVELLKMHLRSHYQHLLKKRTSPLVSKVTDKKILPILMEHSNKLESARLILSAIKDVFQAHESHNDMLLTYLRAAYSAQYKLKNNKLPVLIIDEIIDLDRQHQDCHFLRKLLETLPEILTLNEENCAIKKLTIEKERIHKQFPATPSFYFFHKMSSTLQKNGQIDIIFSILNSKKKLKSFICQLITPIFNHRNKTTETKQDYSDFLNYLLSPKNLSSQEIIELKK